MRLRAKDLRERVGERVDRERLASHRRGLEERQAGERSVEPGSVGRDDAIAVDGEPDERELGTARRIADDLDHSASVATPSGSDSLGTCSRQVGALPASEPGLAGPELPYMVCWFTIVEPDPHGVVIGV